MLWGKKIAFSSLCGVILINTSHIDFQDKYGIAYRGEWLYSFGSTASPLEVDSAGCRPPAVQHALCFDAELGCSGADGSPAREMALGGGKQRVLAWEGGAVLSTRSLAEAGVWVAAVDAGPFLGGEGFSLCFLLIRESGSFPLCIYVGEIHNVFILYLPMQKYKGHGYFLSLRFIFY